MQRLTLERPLIFFDLETTGTSTSNDRIVEIAVVKLFPNGERTVKTLLVNPQMPIPKGASDVHGITDEKVAKSPTFKIIAPNLLAAFENCDLAGYNIIKFDIPMLINEFKRCDINFDMTGRKVIDAYNIFCKIFPRTLTGAYKYFCGKDLEGAHGAEADTLATLEVLLGQLEKHPELDGDVASLHELSDNRDPNAIDNAGRFKWSGDDAIVNFGKNAGMTLQDVATKNPGFFRWLINADFPEDTKAIAQAALQGDFPQKAKQDE